MLWLRALVMWILLVGVEVLHGIVRAKFLVPFVGDVRSRQIGVFSGSALNLGMARLFLHWVGPRSDRALIGVGMGWAVLTVMFEVAFGRLVARLPWKRIREDFDVAHGGLLPLGLMAIAGSPIVAERLRRGHRIGTYLKSSESSMARC